MCERAIRPGAGGDDQSAGGVAAATGFNLNLAGTRTQRRDRREIEQRRAKTNGDLSKNVGRALGGDDARVGLKETVYLVADAPAWPALARIAAASSSSNATPQTRIEPTCSDILTLARGPISRPPVLTISCSPASLSSDAHAR